MAASGGVWVKGRFYEADTKRAQSKKKTAAAVAGKGGGRVSSKKDIEQLRKDELESLRHQIDALIRQREKEEKREKAPARVGKVVRTFGQDPRQKYNLQYELVEMDTLVTSNDNEGKINPNYPQELQPRDRTRQSSKMQIQRIASDLDPEAMTTEFRTLDRGAPIIGKDDNVVESGNGRTISLRVAAKEYPEQYEKYKAELRQVAAEKGIDPDQVDKLKNPVLVRRRVDDVNRVKFAQEANSAVVLGMSDSEKAKSDAGRISSSQLQNLEIAKDGDIDNSLSLASNRPFVRAFVAELPDNERADIVTRDGQLTQTGQRRIKAAIFNRTYDSPALSDRIFESQDNDIKNITNGLVSSAAKVGQAEELVRAGKRGKDLSITDDVAKAAAKYADIRKRGEQVDDYLKQQALFGRDLNPTQEKILVLLDKNKRSAKKVKDALDAYADQVITAPDPAQGGLFGGASESKEQFVDRWLNNLDKEQPQPMGRLF